MAAISHLNDAFFGTDEQWEAFYRSHFPNGATTSRLETIVEQKPESDLTRLIKLMKMTTSSNSAEALVAMRKANEELKRLGWDWERILSGKITIIEDPFTSMRKVSSSRREGFDPASTPPPSQPYDPFNVVGAQPAPAPRPAWQPMPLPINSTRVNQYDGNCYCCGEHVTKGQARLFKPSDYSRWASDKSSAICLKCNASSAHIIPNTAAKRKPAPRTQSVDDL